jgi:hypothetical protein
MKYYVGLDVSFSPPPMLLLARVPKFANVAAVQRSHDSNPRHHRRAAVVEGKQRRPQRGWILSVAESTQEPDRYGDESSANP